MATRFMGGYQRQAFFLAVSGLQLFTPLGMTPIFSKRTLAAVKSSGDAAQDDALWEATMDEVAARFLQTMLLRCRWAALSLPDLAWLSETNYD